MKFYRCDVCGKIIVILNDTGVPTICCGESMTELKAGVTDGAAEKHVPVYEVKDGKVTVCVGSVDHPMLDNHYINWICIETSKGYQIKCLKPGDAPKAEFLLAEGESLVAVYEYCNLHGLWKS